MPASWLHSSAARVSLANHPSAVQSAVQTIDQPATKLPAKSVAKPTVQSPVQSVVQPPVQSAGESAVKSADQSSIQSADESVQPQDHASAAVFTISHPIGGTKLKQGNCRQNTTTSEIIRFKIFLQNS